MLKIDLPKQEFFNEKENVFFFTKPSKVRLEHSLISVSKWEAIWEKPFLPTPGVVEGMRGRAQELSYIECMIIGEVPEHVPMTLLDQYATVITKYIEKKHTATLINRYGPSGFSRQTITSELIYYWMLKFGIPFECQMWHLNRLLMLIEVCSVKDNAGKGGSLSSTEAANHINKINKARRGL